MRTPVILSVTALSVLASYQCQADGLTFQIKEPNVAVTIPNIPQMKMDVHPMHEARPHLRLLGSDGPYSVSIMTPTADTGMTALECASSTIKNLGSRPGVPAPSQVYKARINDRTFVAIYASTITGFMQLHAHLLSAANGTHCIEVHASKVASSKDDIDPWFKGFGEATIEAN